MKWRQGSWAQAVVTAALLVSCTDLDLDFLRQSDAGPADAPVLPDAPSDVSADDPTDAPVPGDATEDTSDVSFDVPEEPSTDAPADGSGTPCQKESDCSGNTPHCNPATHFCFTCDTDAICGIGMRCNTSIPKCARQCSSGSQCPTSVCDTTFPNSVSPGYCVDCMFDTDCAGGQTCIRPQGLCTSQ